jgi:lysophospholipase L1-like esterase
LGVSDLPVLRFPRRFLAAALFAAAAVFMTVSPASAAIELPQRFGAIGDSLTAAFGAGGANIDSVRYSFATGGDLRAERLGYSHLSRLQGMNNAIDGVNVARSGEKLASIIESTTDGNGDPLPSCSVAPAPCTDNQIVLLPANVEYVTVTVGSSDVCQGANPTGLGSFRRNVPQLFSQLRSRLGVAHIVVLPVPDWFTIWNKFKGDATVSSRWASSGVCPRLFGAGATPDDRSQVDEFTRAYNEILANQCSLVNTSRFKCSYAKQVFNINWKKDDLSTYDGFHPSAKGQAKISRAAWSASPYRLRAYGVKFNRKPTFNRGTKILRLNFVTAPHAHVGIAVTNKNGHLLGSSSAEASATGTVITKFKVRKYHGQSKIIVRLKLRINDEKMTVKRTLRL